MRINLFLFIDLVFLLDIIYNIYETSVNAEIKVLHIKHLAVNILHSNLEFLIPAIERVFSKMVLDILVSQESSDWIAVKVFTAPKLSILQYELTNLDIAKVSKIPFHTLHVGVLDQRR